MKEDRIYKYVSRYPPAHRSYETHLLKTSRKSGFSLFEYDAPFERERNPL